MTEKVDHARVSILHQRPYRETSLLIEAFSREHGRLGLVANGARRPKSRLRALLQPLQEVSMSWTQRGDLASLRQAEAVGHVPRLSGDALFAGFYINELLLRLCVRGDPHPELYDSYRQCIAQLGQPIKPGWALRLFERDLLDAIGYGLQLTHEADTGDPIQAGMRYHFDPQQGARRRGATEGDSSPATISGAALLALHSGAMEDDDLRGQAKQVLQMALQRLLDNRPLRSVQTMRQLRVGLTKQQEK